MEIANRDNELVNIIMKFYTEILINASFTDLYGIRHGDTCFPLSECRPDVKHNRSLAILGHILDTLHIAYTTTVTLIHAGILCDWCPYIHNTRV